MLARAIDVEIGRRMRRLLLLGALTLLAGAAPWLVGLDPGSAGPFSRAALLPYAALPIAAMGGAIAAVPRRPVFPVAHPVAFALWSYLAIFFGVGPVVFSLGGVSHIDPRLLAAPAHSYRLALVYVAIGIVGLAAGALAPSASRAGAWLVRRLPGRAWPPDALLAPGWGIVAVGTLFYVASVAVGVRGYQLKGVAGASDAAIVFLSSLLTLGQFLVWLAIFRSRLTSRFVWSAVLLVALLPVLLALSGSRGFLFSHWVVLVLAYFLAGRPPTLRSLAGLTLVGALSVALGLVYGTAFRLTKSDSPPPTAAPAPVAAAPLTTEQRVARDQRPVALDEQAALALDSARMGPLGRALEVIPASVAARLDTISSLAVLVDREATLRPRLPATLRHGILLGLATAVVPRAVWRDKPIVGDIRAYGRLFFGLESNAFAVTPMGDLILNFGAWSIPWGMALIGWLLAACYGTLDERHPGVELRAATYAVVLMAVSYEGFYATIVPGALRVVAVAVVALAGAHWLARRRSRSIGAAAPSGAP
jgi:hypothetical protein